MSAHDELKANAAGYVLSSLDADERRAFEGHLAGCAECAAEVASLRPVVGALATVVPQVTPRAELRERVLGSAGHDVAQKPRTYAAWLPLAASVLLTIGVAVYAMQLRREVSDLQARLDQTLLQASAATAQVADARRAAGQMQSAMSVLAAPDLARIDLAGQMVAPNARARALWSRARGLVFTAANLPALPAGKVYQVWVVTAQAPVSAGLLEPDPSGGGTAYYMTSPNIGAPVAVAVTLEPEGGVPAPTGEKYLVGMP